MSICRLVFIVLLCSLQVLISCFAQLPEHGVGATYSGYPWIGDVDVSVITNECVVDGQLLDKARAELKSHVGEKWANRFRFLKVESIPVEQIKILPKWEVPYYSFMFCYSNATKGLQYYDIGVNLRKDGSLIGGIKFPSHARMQNVDDLIAVEDAYTVAKVKGFLFTNFDVSLLWLPECDDIAWQFKSLFYSGVRRKNIHDDIVLFEILVSATDKRVIGDSCELFFEGKAESGKVRWSISKEPVPEKGSVE